MEQSMAAFGQQPPRNFTNKVDIFKSAEEYRRRTSESDLGKLTAFEALTLALREAHGDLTQQDRDAQDENIFGFAEYLGAAIRDREYPGV
jgi:hypothetical protein